MAAGKMGKKQSNFSVTCSLLSQYLKEKGSLGGLGLESMSSSKPLLDQQLIKDVNRKPTTMNLLPGANIDDAEVEVNQATPKSMDLFPQHAGFEEDRSSRASINIKEPVKAPLTIFYGGKVLVFDDFPEEKAKDLMQIAGKEAGAVAAPNSLFTASSANQSVPAPAPAPENGLVKPSTPAVASDMPIARRNSLHRFLEKRKDRISAKAPYQVHGGAAAPPESAKATQRDSSRTWLGLGREVFNPEENFGSRRR